MVGHEIGPRGGLPPYLVVPSESSPYLHAGHLGSAHNPFAVGGNPNDPQFQVRDVEEAEGITPRARSAGKRCSIRLTRTSAASIPQATLESVDRFTAQAYDLIRSPQARAAFDLGQVDDRTRERYGRTQLGQGCLLARRLVEAGVPCVTVSSDDWDHHQNLYPRLRAARCCRRSTGVSRRWWRTSISAAGSIRRWWFS